MPLRHVYTRIEPDTLLGFYSESTTVCTGVMSMQDILASYGPVPVQMMAYLSKILTCALVYAQLSPLKSATVSTLGSTAAL